MNAEKIIDSFEKRLTIIIRELELAKKEKIFLETLVKEKEKQIELLQQEKQILKSDMITTLGINISKKGEKL